MGDGRQEGLKADLGEYIGKGATAVHDYTDHIQKIYGKPALRASQSYFDSNPVHATFFAIFSCLSIIPVTLFIGASLFTLCAVLFSAVAGGLFLSTLLISGFFASLVIVLIGAIFIAISLTSIACLAYMVVRFFQLFRSKGQSGVRTWFSESQKLVFGVMSSPLRAEGSSPRRRTNLTRQEDSVLLQEYDESGSSAASDVKVEGSPS